MRGPLHGIPVLIKDNIDTADRMATTAGSLALVGARPRARRRSSSARLRAAGRGPPRQDEPLASGRTSGSTHSTSGWSGRGGLTRNPYALDRNPCGSSSGSGVAVAANLCAAAVGTETDGSIVSPSSANGIVGVKPTVGLVSRSGIIPISHSQDTRRPDGAHRARRGDPARRPRRRRPARRGHAATAARRRPTTRRSSTRAASRARGSASSAALLRLPATASTPSMAEALAALMKQRAPTLVDPADLPTAGQDRRAGGRGPPLRVQGRPERLPRPPRARRRPCESLADVIAFNEKHAKEEMPYFGQDMFLKAEAKGPLTSFEYLEALAKCRRLARTEGIDATMDKHRLDALVAPTLGPACVTDLVNGDRWLGDAVDRAGRRGLSARHRAGGLRVRPAGRASRSSGGRGASGRS